jgi:hypothetical protein
MVTRFIATTSSGIRLEIAPPGRPVLELLSGESVTISAAGVTVDSITADESNPSAPVITDLAIAAIDTLGSYHFVVTCAGIPVDFWLCVFEADCLTAVPDHATGIGPAAPPITAAGKRLVIRSVANSATWFDGTAASMLGRSLYSFGA